MHHVIVRIGPRTFIVAERIANMGGIDTYTPESPLRYRKWRHAADRVEKLQAAIRLDKAIAGKRKRV